MFVKLSETGQKLAAEWVDPADEHGRTWLSLSRGESVAELAIWPAWEAEAAEWLRAYRRELKGSDAAYTEELIGVIDELRQFGEVLFEALGMPAILRRIAAWLAMGGDPGSSIGCMRCSSVEEHMVAAAFGSTTQVLWCGKLGTVREAARYVQRLGFEGWTPEARGHAIRQLTQAAGRLEDEAYLAQLLEDLEGVTSWSPDNHQMAWDAAAAAVGLPGWEARVDTTGDGLQLVIRKQAPEGEGGGENVASLPIRAGVDSGGFRSGPPDIRGLVAELTAIDAAMPHGQSDPWPAEVSRRREELAVRLWRTCLRTSPDVWPGEAPEVGHQWDRSDAARPLVLVVQLPDGPEIRAHVREDALSPRELGPEEAPWDGAAPDYAARAAWLARTA